ncbi:MAG: ATP-binding protein, partial [Azonexus sp.]|nr:ATP-binding protein [Azonexus sp.]
LGQAEWLRVLLRNLVDNAVSYTPALGQVRVSITGDNESAVIEICDSGPGIPISEREAVLRRFYRLNQDEPPGSGLGLAIVARIAELHGARLVLAEASPAPGLSVKISWQSTTPTFS